MDVLAIGVGFGSHPAARFLIFHVVTAVIGVITLLVVANARKQSPCAALCGVGGIVGLIIGLLFLIAMPSRVGQAPN